MNQQDQETYSTAEVARILRVTPQMVRKLVAEEVLPATKDANGAWRLPQREVHAYLEVRRSQRPQDASQGPTEIWERVADLERQLGRVEGRLELTERTESSLREERDRLLEDLEREREERRALQEQIMRTRRSWWRRFFGIE